MRNVLVLLCVFVSVAVLFGGCVHRVKPDAGEEAVLVMKPMIFGAGGVDSDPVRTGAVWAVFTTDEVIVDMKPQQHEVKFDDLMSSDGVPLDFDSVIRLRVLDSVELIRTFGPEWYEQNVRMEFMNRVRQAVRKHGLNETAIDTTAIDAIDDEVSVAMATYLEQAKLPVELIGVTVGKANPPDSVKSQRIATAAEQQRALTEGQRKLAEDARKNAEDSRANADNAYRNKMSLDQAQFIQLEQLKMLHDVCGHGHCTFLVGQMGQGVAPVVNVANLGEVSKKESPAK